MQQMLQPGQTVQTQSGTPCQVDRLLGAGGQGEVYRVNWSGGNFALKWYYCNPSDAQQVKSLQDQRKSLEKLLGPAPSDAFLWPLDIACLPGTHNFGYLMRLREPRFRDLEDLIYNRVKPMPDFRTLATIGLALADNFHKLHCKGLCYRDISFGNAFIDPKTGDVAICDNDNVTEDKSPVCAVLGTQGFMAPEVYCGKLPSERTDLHSLAVLLFRIFLSSHPLKGKRLLNLQLLDEEATQELLGTKPLFIFDPSDRSNEAVDDPEAGKTAKKYWNIYPQFLKEAFTRAFTKGLHDPDNGRLVEDEWRRILSRLRDAIFYCACGIENFYDLDAMRASGGKAGVCWSCKKQLRFPYRVRIDDTVVMLSHVGKLYPHHLDNARSKSYDFTRAVAEVVRHPTDPNIWGLKNCTTEKWVVTVPDGSLSTIEPGRSVILQPNVKVNFGKVEGEIRY